MPTSPTPEERIVQLEMLTMHLQHDLEQINAVALAQQAEIAELRQLVSRLERRLESTTQPPETRDVVDERPPHY